MSTDKGTQTMTFDEATKAWKEKTAEWQRQVKEYQDSALANIARSQQAYADELRRFTESTNDTKAPATNWPQIAQSVNAAYDFAIELINQQRAFAKSIVEAAASGASK